MAKFTLQNELSEKVKKKFPRFACYKFQTNITILYMYSLILYMYYIKIYEVVYFDLVLFLATWI